MQAVLLNYQTILRLSDWNITLHEDDAIETPAETKLIFNDYKAIIRIKNSLCDSEKELTLIHELLHLIYRDAYDIFADTIQDDFTRNYCSRQHERAIEKTANIIYKLVHQEGG